MATKEQKRVKGNVAIMWLCMARLIYLYLYMEKRMSLCNVDIGMCHDMERAEEKERKVWKLIWFIFMHWRWEGRLIENCGGCEMRRRRRSTVFIPFNSALFLAIDFPPKSSVKIQFSLPPKINVCVCVNGSHGNASHSIIRHQREWKALARVNMKGI
jgi:hypothetical protein